MNIHPVAADPRYARVKQLVAEGRDEEAQNLENEISADVARKEDKTLFHSGAHKRRALRAYERTNRKREARANAGSVQIDRGLRLSARQTYAMHIAMRGDEG